MDLPLFYQDIIRILPHRYPFLFVDRIIELELNKRVVGIKNVTSTNRSFRGISLEILSCRGFSSSKPWRRWAAF